MQELIKTLSTEFHDKEYAHAYMEDFSNIAIATQIKVLREQREWTQQELATLSKMKQERISALEDIDYNAWTLKTLRKLARAFDLTVKISFENFSSGLLDIEAIDKENLERVSREEDINNFSHNVFSNQIETTTNWSATVLTTKPQLTLVKNTNAANDEWQSFSEPVVIAASL